MAVVWKAPLNPGVTEVIARRGSKVLCVDKDPMGVPCVWFTAVPERDKITLIIVSTATGEEFPPGATYLGSFIPEPGLMFHAWRPR